MNTLLILLQVDVKSGAVFEVAADSSGRYPFNMTKTSIFTYAITRQYPAVFTWIILAGGAILTTLFTFVAFAGNAYQLETYYTNDYNATIADCDTPGSSVVLTSGD